MKNIKLSRSPRLSEFRCVKYTDIKAKNSGASDSISYRSGFKEYVRFHEFNIKQRNNASYTKIYNSVLFHICNEIIIKIKNWADQEINC